MGVLISSVAHSGCSERDVVNKGGGKSRNPDDQNQSHRHLVIGGNPLYQVNHEVTNILYETQLLETLIAEKPQSFNVLYSRVYVQATLVMPIIIGAPI